MTCAGAVSESSFAHAPCQVHETHPEHKSKTIQALEEAYAGIEEFKNDWEVSRDAVIVAGMEASPCNALLLFAYCIVWYLK